MSDNPLEHRDDVGARMAMWLFLYTELLLFGVLSVGPSSWRGRRAPRHTRELSASTFHFRTHFG